MRQVESPVGLRICRGWVDDDFFEVAVTVWNGTFGGRTELYLGSHEPEQIASKLEGFPQSRTDERVCELGHLSLRRDNASVRLRFYSRDSAGHACVEVEIAADSVVSNSPDRVMVTLSILPAGVDNFVANLRRLQQGTADEAWLYAE